jgi:tRNA pseudouridine32 synthase/23S rRNA pseudouridine746 synthase
MCEPERRVGQVDLNIVHADASLVVIDKPAGLLSVPGRGPDKADCAYARVLENFADAQVVHRLDMDTSGLLLFARGKFAQRILSMAFAARQVHKRYVALVENNAQAIYQNCSPDGEGWAKIDWPIRVDWPQRPKSVVDLEAGKPCLTRWRIDPEKPQQLILEPVTGRSHQLRVHLSTLGLPIVGDPLYGLSSQSRMMLHACDLWIPSTEINSAQHFHSASPF